MRFSPRSIFFSVVALGLPFAVTVGWTLGTPTPAPPAVSAPGGAGGIGAAPPQATTVTTATTATTSPVLDGSPRPAKPVAAAVESSLPGRPGPAARTRTAPSDSPPPVIVPSDDSPDPTLTLLPPVPTPTQIVTTPPSPSATEPYDSAAPGEFGLGAARLVRGP